MRIKPYAQFHSQFNHKMYLSMCVCINMQRDHLLCVCCNYYVSVGFIMAYNVHLFSIYLDSCHKSLMRASNIVKCLECAGATHSSNGGVESKRWRKKEVSAYSQRALITMLNNVKETERKRKRRVRRIITTTTTTIGNYFFFILSLLLLLSVLCV